MIDFDGSFKELKINPDRFCEAISKIGYRPVPAIMDIIDNSIAAGASRVEVELVLKAGTTMATSGNVESFNIRDNGSGMTSAGIDTALEIGSDVVYAEHSLSKFGLGLKSAGFSLGRRIEVASKTAGSGLIAKYVDRDVIQRLGKYGVCDLEAYVDESSWLERHGHGTIVSISKNPKGQDSATKIRRELRDKLGVTYADFLSRPDAPLEIKIKVAREVQTVEARDILHWDTAHEKFDPDNYDGKRPCRVYDGPVLGDLFGPDEKMTLQVAIFPKAKMANFAGFTPDEKLAIKGFEISRENSGFFFYRNGRLIKWGDKFAGAGRDDIGFRAKLSFSTAYDDVLHVDVSKQHLEISEELEEKIELLCRLPISDSRKAFELCDKMLDQSTGTEGNVFNELTETIEEADAAEEQSARTVEEVVKRREVLEAKTKRRELNENPVAADVEAASGLGEKPPSPFQRIRYSDKVGGLDLAVPGTDYNEGTYVRINQNHPFYYVVMNSFDAAAPPRLALEAVLWAAAVAQTKTAENLDSISIDQIVEVFDYFRRVFSENMNVWVSKNQNLFG